jgi:tetratricopeptide (TPR) repeat protein
MRLQQPFCHCALLFSTFFLVFAYPLPGNAQIAIDADRQFNYAQQRFNDGAYDEAIVEFNRFIYFFPEDSRIEIARFQIGMAHFNAGNNQDAVKVFAKLTERASPETMVADAYFMLSKSHAGLGKINQAMVDLRNVMVISSDPDVQDRARYELAWLLIDTGRWNEALQAISEISAPNADRFQVYTLQQDLAKSDQIPKKSPTAAGVLSILPGAGQAYCGRYKDALTALFVNTGLIWAAYEAFDNELYALGGVITFVGFGFYAGNIYGAVSGAHKYNRDRVLEFRDGLARRNRVHLSLGAVRDGWTVGLKMEF